MSVGGSWLNEEVVRFVWRDSVAPAASPQVIVIARPVNTANYLSGKIVVQSAVLAILSPPREMRAEGGGACVCNDTGTGTYACNSSQTACIVGVEKCVVTCS